MLTIQCPSCGVDNKLSLAESTCEAALRCWKCRGLWVATIENEQVKSCEPLSEEELESYTD